MAAGSELAPAGGDDRRDLESLQQQVTDRPLSAAPPGCRRAVWRLWTCHQHLFPSPLPLAAVVGVWVRERGLAEEDANQILAAALSPGRMAAYRFAADLMTDLATAAQAAIDRRRREAQDRADRERRAREAAEAAPPAVVRELIAQVAGRMTGAGADPAAGPADAGTPG